MVDLLVWGMGKWGGREGEVGWGGWIGEMESREVGCNYNV